MTRQRAEVINCAARAYHFHALRQPHVAALLDGLDVLSREASNTSTRAGCERIARLLDLVLTPARALLAEAEGEAREWMAAPAAHLAAAADQARVRLLATAEQAPADLRGPFPSPHAADHLVVAVHRTWHDLDIQAAPEPLRAAAEKAPATPCARRADDCGCAAAALRTIARAATAADSAGAFPTQQALVRELAALSTDGAERLEATAALLKDTHRRGKVSAITSDLERAELGEEDNAGRRPVQIDGQEAGPITRTPPGGWTGPGITAPYHSPEGATTALVRLHDARHTAHPRRSA